MTGHRDKAIMNATSITEGRRKRKAYHAVMRDAQKKKIQLQFPSGLPDALDKIFRRTHALWHHAATVVDKLSTSAPPGAKNSIWTYKWDENGNKIVEPSKWVAYESALRKEVFEQAAIMQKLNIDEARVRIEQAQLDLLAQALKNAARKANLDDQQQRSLGAALREELSIIEGTAEEISPIEHAA